MAPTNVTLHRPCADFGRIFRIPSDFSTGNCTDGISFYLDECDIDKLPVDVRSDLSGNTDLKVMPLALSDMNFWMSPPRHDGSLNGCPSVRANRLLYCSVTTTYTPCRAMRCTLCSMGKHKNCRNQRGPPTRAIFRLVAQMRTSCLNRNCPLWICQEYVDGYCAGWHLLLAKPLLRYVA